MIFFFSFLFLLCLSILLPSNNLTTPLLLTNFPCEKQKKLTWFGSKKLGIFLTILLPSESIISPDSTRVFRMQVTWVGALSASSITRTLWGQIFAWARILTKINFLVIYLPDFTALTRGESSYTITPSFTIGWRVKLWKHRRIHLNPASLFLIAQ